jgi:hypothetical protein
MKAYEKLLAIFLIILGAAIIAVWSLLLARGNVFDVDANLFSFLFHWASELLLAVLSVVVAVSLFSQKRWAKKLGLFVLGVSICSTFHAAYYYFIEQQILFLAVMVSIFFGISVVFLLLGFRAWWFTSKTQINLLKLSLAVLGILVYYLLNIAGQHGQEGEWSSFANALFLMVIAVFFLVKIRIGASA